MVKPLDKFKLQAISILDGRNRERLAVVSDYFSEFALIKYRVRVEIEYLVFLSVNTRIVRKFTNNELAFLKSIWMKFNLDDGQSVKQFEARINHDVKAVEYFLQQKLAKTTLKDITSFLHFGLTSYDVNIPAYALMLKEFNQEAFIPTINKLLKSLQNLIGQTKNMPMLARTHGQPALPTTMGKELAVFYHRITSEVRILSDGYFEAKLTGAVGNFNALYFVYPEYDWITISRKFIKSLGLQPNVVTTQILPYDNWLRFFDSIKRLNNILLGLVQDLWWYISFEYFGQKKKEEEVGSSTMSHKINPITFENAEGNLQLANSLFEFLVRKLAVSRLQRDLSDSTIKRDFGLSLGFTLLAWDSILSGLARITPHPNNMKEDLDKHWEIFAEGIQTYLRSLGYKDAFETIKGKTRGNTLTKEEIHKLIEELPISKEHKKRLEINSLEDYLGLAPKIAQIAIQDK